MTLNAKPPFPAPLLQLSFSMPATLPSAVFTEIKLQPQLGEIVDAQSSDTELRWHLRAYRSVYTRLICRSGSAVRSDGRSDWVSTGSHGLGE